MLQCKNGATMSEITKNMGCQRHTVRGFMAGTMKKAMSGLLVNADPRYDTLRSEPRFQELLKKNEPELITPYRSKCLRQGFSGCRRPVSSESPNMRSK